MPFALGLFVLIVLLVFDIFKYKWFYCDVDLDSIGSQRTEQKNFFEELTKLNMQFMIYDERNN